MCHPTQARPWGGASGAAALGPGIQGGPTRYKIRSSSVGGSSCVWPLELVEIENTMEPLCMFEGDEGRIVIPCWFSNGLILGLCFLCCLTFSFALGPAVSPLVLAMRILSLVGLLRVDNKLISLVIPLIYLVVFSLFYKKWCVFVSCSNHCQK
jgi:hypothetical protein